MVKTATAGRQRARRESFKVLDKGTIRKQAIIELSLRGCKVWVQNNIAVKGRKFIGERGIGDVSGYVKQTGIRVECEIKAIGDTLSAEQIHFLTELKKAGGIALIATQEANQVVIKDFPTTNDL